MKEYIENLIQFKDAIGKLHPGAQTVYASQLDRIKTTEDKNAVYDPIEKRAAATYKEYYVISLRAYVKGYKALSSDIKNIQSSLLQEFPEELNRKVYETTTALGVINSQKFRNDMGFLSPLNRQNERGAFLVQYMYGDEIDFPETATDLRNIPTPLFDCVLDEQFAPHVRKFIYVCLVRLFGIGDTWGFTLYLLGESGCGMCVTLETIPISKKGEDSFAVKLTALLLFAGNWLPHYIDKGQATRGVLVANF
ncbi:hypothetical protein BDK51DRAFT_26594 [Blyttiomyces helicus]|uniref:Uncharacterized protein n=1 Tax=Blyttiomyces helicus TaxID=388810 RepID=A0A4P9WQM0_9FUNG|nr:hypothetical protein BDK51DRAFT_26594 [Blyttiomyces helicus]|eukprot:RKO93176.1 hypothetical protein BDK51DRAFT_26594 [Blyttiomyces helicus]